MGRFSISVLLILFSLASYAGPVKDEFIRVVQSDSGRYVNMGIKTYADFYLHKKELIEIKKIIPSIKDSVKALKHHNKKVREISDSLNLYNGIVVDSLTNDRDVWKNLSFQYSNELKEKEFQLQKEKNNRGKYYGGGVITVILLRLATLLL